MDFLQDIPRAIWVLTILVFCTLFAFVCGFLFGKSKRRVVHVRSTRVIECQQRIEDGRGSKDRPLLQLGYGANIPEPRVHFFPEKREICKNYIETFRYSNPSQRCSNSSCSRLHLSDRGRSSIIQILECLRGAKKIDVCMYSFTLSEASKVLIILKEKGARVRVIKDNKLDSDKHRNDRTGDLEEAGIEVRSPFRDPSATDVERPLMHHKFAIIDERLVLTGSFNWTTKGRNLNDENLIEEYHPAVVKRFADKFLELWAQYSPDKTKVASLEYRNSRRRALSP